MSNSTAPFQQRATAWLETSNDAFEKITEWMQRRQLHVLGIFSICYFVAMFATAQQKLFWFDELFTYYLATLPSVDAIVGELDKRVDHHPLSYFLLMRASDSLWPDPHLSFRIPSIVGFWLLSLCLFRFVTRRTSTVFGVIAMLAPYMTGAQYWVADARPYGPAVGLLALGFVAWQTATIAVRRVGPLVLLGVAIAAALSTSYYSAVALVPLAVAELVRTAKQRRIDLQIWLAMGAGASVGLVYLPTVMRSVEGFVSDGWARPRLGSLVDMYRHFFLPTLPFWLGCLLLFGLLLMVRRWGRIRNKEAESELPLAEVVLSVGLLLLPVIGLAVAFGVTKMITTRYVISTVTGFCILLAFLTYCVSRARATTGVALIAVTLLSSLVNYWFIEWETVRERRASVQRVSTLLEQAPADTAGLPVVFENPLHLFQACHYTDRSLAQRFVFLSDPESSVSYSGVRYTGRGMMSLQRYAPLRVEQYSDFRHTHSRFLLYRTPFMGEYVLARLLDEGAELRLLGHQGRATLYLVD